MTDTGTGRDDDDEAAGGGRLGKLAGVFAFWELAQAVEPGTVFAFVGVGRVRSRLRATWVARLDGAGVVDEAVVWGAGKLVA